MKFDQIVTKAAEFSSEIVKMLDMEKTNPSMILSSLNKVEELVERNKKDVTTHQLRNIFKLIKDADQPRQLIILRPRLAYIGARQDKDGGKIIVKVIDDLIKKVNEETSEDIKERKLLGLQYIMESIVAFHKFHSDK